MSGQSWHLGDGSNSVESAVQNQDYRFFQLARMLVDQGVSDQASFNALATYLGLSGGSGQDMQVAWTPTNLKLGEMIGLSAFQNATAIPGIASLVINWTTNPEGFDIESAPDLISLSAPSLTDITGGGYLYLSGGPVLTTVSLPMLQTVGAGLSIISNPSLTSLTLSALTIVGSGGSNLDLHGNTSLVSLALPSLTTINSGIGANFLVNGCTALVTVSLPVFSQTNGTDVIFSGCALSVASVNHILARCVSNVAYVSGTVDLSGQTPVAPPSGQGIADKAALILRGVAVNTD